MRFIIIIASTLLFGCATTHYVEVPGPAYNTDCQRTGSMGRIAGEYKCQIEGQYELNNNGL